MKKRRMIFIPEVNPASFVFFFERGNSGTSWSLRDYSIRNCVRERGPRDFPWTADEIHQKAQYSFDAPTVSTDDLAFWRKQTEELNARYLGKPAPAATVAVVPPIPSAGSTSPVASVPSGNAIPVLNLSELSDSSQRPQVAGYGANPPFAQQRGLGYLEFLPNPAQAISDGMVGPSS